MRPEHWAQSSAPAVGLTKQIEETLLLAIVVLASRGLDLDLCAKRDRMDCLIRHGVFDPQLQREQRRSGEGNGLGAFHTEVEIRQWPPPSIPRKTAGVWHTIRCRLRVRANWLESG